MNARRVAGTSTPNLMGGRGNPTGPPEPNYPTGAPEQLEVDLTQPIPKPAENEYGAGLDPHEVSQGAPASPVDAETSLNERAQVLMNQREFSAAGDLFEEAGNHMRAIDASELALSCPEDGFGDGAITAWQRELIDRIQWLYERNGSPELAAEFLQRIGLRGEAVDLFMKVGDRPRAAQILEEDRKFDAAAQIYQQLGDQQRSIRCLAQARSMVGDLPSAGDLYAEIGDLQRAASLYDDARKKGILNEGQWRERMNALGPGMAPPPPPPQAPRNSRPARPPRPQSAPQTPPHGVPNRPRGRTRRTGALGQAPNQRPRRATRGNPMPRNLQADVSALHRLPGAVPGGAKAPAPPRRRNPGGPPQNPPPRPPNAQQSGIMRPARGQAPGQGVRRTPTRRLTGALNRVTKQNPPPPPPSATRSGIRRPPPPSGRRRNPPPPPPQARPSRPPQREGLRRGAPPPPQSSRNTGLFRRNNLPGNNNHSLMAQAEEFEQNGQIREAADLFLQAGSNAKARGLFKELEDWKAVADSWRGDNKHYEAGILYFVLGQIDEAIRELTRVPDEDPDALPARRVVAILYGLIGRLADAKTYFDVSFSDTVGPNDLESLYYYAQVLEQDDRTWEDALDIYATVLELSPHYRDARQRMDSLQQGHGNPVSSIYEDAERDRESLFYALQEAVMAR
ncbi:MAG: tetratricopeptide repeat protein [Planctomycetota bacterium]|nr:tetratricopeptide repeat protein [Planctomycetota bacterium]